MTPACDQTSKYAYRPKLAGGVLCTAVNNRGYCTVELDRVRWLYKFGPVGLVYLQVLRFEIFHGVEQNLKKMLNLFL